MLILKIMTLNNTEWVGDIRTIRNLGPFPKEAKEDPMEALNRSKLIDNSHKNMTFHCSEFTDENYGTLLFVERAGPSGDVAEFWIVPSGSCFLMSDNGKTIDRF